MVRIDGCRRYDVVLVRQDTAGYPLAEFVKWFAKAFNLIKGKVGFPAILPLWP
jgi:hypothetical protein